MIEKITTISGISIILDKSKICQNCAACCGELEIVIKRLFPNEISGNGMAVVECLSGSDSKKNTRRLNIRGAVNGTPFESMMDLKDWGGRNIHCGQEPKKAARS